MILLIEMKFKISRSSENSSILKKVYISQSRKIDEIYTNGIKNGANGGKLLGAGGGGFILFYVKNENKDKFLHYFKNKPIMHIKLNNNGSKIKI